MESKLLFVLLASSIVASAFGISFPRRQVLSRVRNACISQCGAGAVKSGYAPGWEYSYSYYMSTDTQLARQAVENGGIVFDAEIRIEAISKCQMALHIDKIKVESKNAKEAKENRNFVFAMKKNILYFRFEDGLIDNLCSKDPAWVRNIKRGILSTFHNKIGLPRGTVYETDVSGHCPVRYIWSSFDKQAYKPRCAKTKCPNYPPRNMANKGLLIISRKDMSKCEKHQRILGGISTTRYESDSLNQQAPIARIPNGCEHVINEGIITFAYCEEMVETDSFSSRNIFPGNIHLSKSLLFLKKKRTFCGSGCRIMRRASSFIENYRYHRSTLLFEFDDETKGNGDFKETKELLCKVASKSFFGRLELFMQLIDKLRTTEGAKVFAHKGRYCPTVSQSDVTATLMEAVQMTGTPAAAAYILRSRSLNRIEKDKKLSSFFMVKQPTLDLIEYMSRFIRRYKTYPMAAKATTALVYRFCESKKLCYRTSTLRFVVPYLTREVKASCIRARLSYYKKHAITLFSMVGNLKLPLSLQRDIIACASNPKTPTSVAIAAINALRRSCSLQRDRMLMFIFKETRDTEVRLAAYRTLLRCAQPFIHIRMIAKLIERERDPQVTHFIRSHVLSLRNTQDPSLQRLRMQLRDLRWKFCNVPAIRPASFYSERVYYAAGMNVGLKVEKSRIYRGYESRFRQHSSKYSGFLFGNRIDYLELTIRRENDDQSSRSHTYSNYRVFGHDVFESIYGLDRFLEMPPTDAYLQLQRLLRKYSGKRKSHTKRAILMDTTATLSTSLGLPVKLRVNAATSMKMGNEVDKRSKLLVKVEPNLNFMIGLEMNVAVKDLTYGIKRTASAHHRSSLELIATLENNTLDMQLATPPHIELLSLKHDTYFIRRCVETIQKEKKSSLNKFIEQGREWTFFNFGISKALGYQLELLWYTQRPKGRFSCNTNGYWGLRLRRTDIHKIFTMKAKYQSGNKPLVFLEMDTPGSIVNRRMLGNITGSDDGLELTLVTPWKKLKAEFMYKWKAYPNLSVIVRTENKKYVDVRLHFKWLTKSKKEMVAVARFGDIPFFYAKMSQQRKKYDHQFDLEIIQPFKKPVTFSYHLIRSKENKISIGALSTLTTSLESPFLKSNLRGTLEYSQQYCKSKVIFSYDVPKSDKKGSVGVKFNWNRKKDRIFRDIIKGGISFSQFPDLDLDFMVKSTLISLANFRHDVLLKIGEEKIPVSFMIDFAYRNNPTSSSIKLYSAYVIQGFMAGDLKMRFINNREWLDAFTTFKMNSTNDMSSKIPIIDFDHQIKYHHYTRRLLKGNLLLSGSLLQHEVSVESAIGNRYIPYVGKVDVSLKKLSSDLKEKQNQTVGLKVKINRLSVGVQAASYDWHGKFNAEFHRRRGVGISYSFDENSELKLVGQGNVRYSARFTQIKHSLTKKSKNVYNVTIQTSYRRKIPSGLLDFVLGGKDERRRLKISFSRVRNQHISHLLFQNLNFSTELSNKYNFLISLPDVRLNGTSDLSIGNGTKDKYLLTTNVDSKDNKTANANIDLQIIRNKKNDNVLFKLLSKAEDSEWKKAEITTEITSSYTKDKKIEFSHSHDLFGSQFSSESSLNMFGRKFDLHTDGASTPSVRKFAAVTRYNGSHQVVLLHNYPREDFVNRIPTTTSARESFLEIATSRKTFGINAEFSEKLAASGFPRKFDLSIDPKVKIASEIIVRNFTGNFAYFPSTSDLSLIVVKTKSEPKTMIDISTYPEEWKLEVKDLPDDIPFQLRATLSRQFCNGTAVLTNGTDSELFKFLASFCDLKDQRLLLRKKKNSISYQRSAKPTPKIDASITVNFAYGPIRPNWTMSLQHEGRSDSYVPKSSSLVFDMPKKPFKMASDLSVSDSMAVELTTTVQHVDNKLVDLMLKLKNKGSSEKSSFKSIINLEQIKTKVSATSAWNATDLSGVMYDHDVQIKGPRREFLSKVEKSETAVTYKVSLKNTAKQEYNFESSTNIERRKMNIRSKLIVNFPQGYRINASFTGGKNIPTYYSFDANVNRGSASNYYKVSKLSVTAVPGFNINFDCPIHATKVIIVPKFQQITFGPAFVYSGPQNNSSRPTPFTFNFKVMHKPKSSDCSIDLNGKKAGKSYEAKVALKIFRKSQEKFLFKSNVRVNEIHNLVSVHMKSPYDFTYNVHHRMSASGKLLADFQEFFKIQWSKRGLDSLIRNTLATNVQSRVVRNKRLAEVSGESRRSQAVRKMEIEVKETLNYTRSLDDWTYFTYKHSNVLNGENQGSLDTVLNPQMFLIKAVGAIVAPSTYLTPHPNDGIALLFNLSRDLSFHKPTQKFKNLFFLKTGAFRLNRKMNPISCHFAMNYKPQTVGKRHLWFIAATERLLNSNTVQPKFNMSFFFESASDQRMIIVKTKLFNHLKKYALAETEVKVLTDDPKQIAVDADISLTNRLFRYRIEYRLLENGHATDHDVKYFYQERTLLTVFYTFDRKQQYRKLRLKTNRMRNPLEISTITALTPKRTLLQLTIGKGIRRDDFTILLKREWIRDKQFIFRISHKPTKLDSGIIITGKSSNIAVTAFHKHHRRSSTLHFHIKREKLLNGHTRYKIYRGFNRLTLTCFNMFSLARPLPYSIEILDIKTLNQLSLDFSSGRFLLKHPWVGVLKHEQGLLTLNTRGKRALDFQCQYVSSKVIHCSYHYNPQLLFNGMKQSMDKVKTFVFRSALIAKYVISNEIFGIRLPRFINSRDFLDFNQSLQIWNPLPASAQPKLDFSRTLSVLVRKLEKYLVYGVQTIGLKAAKMNSERCIERQRRKVRKLAAFLNRQRKLPQKAIDHVSRMLQNGIDVRIASIIRHFSNGATEVYSSALNSIQNTADFMERSYFNFLLSLNLGGYEEFFEMLDSRISKKILGNYNNKMAFMEDDLIVRPPILISEILRAYKNFIEKEMGTPVIFKRRLQRVLQIIGYEVVSDEIANHFKEVLTRYYLDTRKMFLRALQIWPPSIKVADAQFGKFELTWYLPNRCGVCLKPPLFFNPVETTISLYRNINNTFTALRGQQ